MSQPLPQDATDTSAAAAGGDRRDPHNRQQAVVAIGRRAVAAPDLSILMQDAASLIAEALDAEFSGVAELTPDGSKIIHSLRLNGPDAVDARPLLRESGLDGTDSLAGYALDVAFPVAVVELSQDTRFCDPFLQRHGIRSAIAIPLKLHGQAFGALLACSRQVQQHDTEDVLFVETVAHLITTTAARVRMEKDFAAERRLAAEVWQTVGAIVLVLDPEGRIVRANRACEQLTGFPSDEIEGRSIWDVFPVPDEADLFQTVFKRLHKGVSAMEHESRLLTKHGERREICWSYSVVRSADRSIESVVATGTDVTAERQAERKAAKAEQIAAQARSASASKQEEKDTPSARGAPPTPPDQPPAEECYLYEDTEWRFDTNLLEEKFTPDTEKWQWINIDTWPRDYTEFILPKIQDVTDDDGKHDDGDFILVSSFMTEDSITVTHGISHPVRVKFYFDAAVGPVNSADIYVNDADYNLTYRDVDAPSLRVYGHDTKDAAFPYTQHDGPFNLAGSQAPPKDFIVWNPAYLYHLDQASHGWTNPPDNLFFQSIVVDGADANEKVFLKQWYVPEYGEPKGDTWIPDCPKVTSPDIVKEYTYILLDTNNKPIAGQPEPFRTTFVLPIADCTDQIGLDCYDILDNDGHVADYTVLRGTNLGHDGGWLLGSANADLNIASDSMWVHIGDTVQFLDHSATVMDIGPAGMWVRVFYGGNDTDESIALNVALDEHEILSAGRHEVHVENPDDTADPDYYGGFNWKEVTTWEWLEPVVEPWYLEVLEVVADTESALVRVGRIMDEGESFFVDGAEYDVAAIYTVDKDDDKVYEFKYITIRNPLPKKPVTIEALTIEKHDTTQGSGSTHRLYAPNLAVRSACPKAYSMISVAGNSPIAPFVHSDSQYFLTLSGRHHLLTRANGTGCQLCFLYVAGVE